MLHDRDYMRGPPTGWYRSVTSLLIVTLIAIYIVECVVGLSHPYVLLDWFGLSVDGFRAGRYWQLLTFQFLHEAPSPWHLVFNCLSLYFFGRAVEDALGPRRYLTVYFASGFLGGCLSLLCDWLLHRSFVALGASAGIMGLTAAYAMLAPNQEIIAFIFPIRVLYLFYIFVAASFIGVLYPYGNIAHAAHLGGLLTGAAYIRWGGDAQRRLARLSPFQSRQRKLELVKAASLGTARTGRPRKDSAADLPSAEFISREVDPILDKISAHGIQSLTPRERQILEAARSRMSRR